MPHPPQEAVAAFGGIAWAEATHEVCVHAVGDDTRACSRLEHTPEAIHTGAHALQERFAGHPLAVCLERTNGPLVSALRQDEFLVLCPVHPGTLAKDRDAVTPSPATDDPTAAALQRALLRPQRDQRTPLTPPSPAMRALEPLVEQRRRLVGDNVRLTNRLPSTLQHDFPHALPWLDDKDTTLCGDVLAPWPTLNAAQLARRATLERFFHAHHGRDAPVIDTRLQALKSAPPLTTDARVIAPHARVVQALVAQLRRSLRAIADFDHAMAPRAQSHPDFPVCAALPGAGAVCAPRLRVACGAQRAR